MNPETEYPKLGSMERLPTPEDGSEADDRETLLDDLLVYLEERAAALEGRPPRPLGRIRAGVERAARRMSRWLARLPGRAPERLRGH